jgi:uncharacterized membrane protein YozB (DUF420 family)
LGPVDPVAAPRNAVLRRDPGRLVRVDGAAAVDAKVLYWTAAQLNMSVIAGLVVLGIYRIRQGQREAHRRCMLAAASLVVLFLVSYVFKLAFLGREDLAAWSQWHVRLLQLHELCVIFMVVGGVIALVLGRKLGRTCLFTRDPADPPPAADHLRRHRLSGRVAAGGALLAWLLAGLVLAGMYARNGS